MKQPIPDEALDDRLGFVGTTGAGKTYNVLGRVERLLAQKKRVVMVDALDVMWGIRLKADGKAPSGFDVVIFGGKHGDLPLTEHSGKIIGETVARMAESCIVCVDGLKSGRARRRFMVAFLEALYETTDPDEAEPYHLILDEADLWAPQKPIEEEHNKLLGLTEEIVRRGRVKGFIPWLLTQRPAVLNKNVLSMVRGLVAFNLTSSQDRDALRPWVEGQAEIGQWKEINAKLPTLGLGQGVVWLPGHGILDIVQFPPRETFDSSRTPKRGERRRKTEMPPLDLETLKEKLAAVAAEVAENNPSALKAEIGRLRLQLAAKPQAAPAAIDPAVLERAREEGLAEGIRRGRREMAQIAAVDMAPIMERMTEHARSGSPETAPGAPPTPAQPRAIAPPPPAPPRTIAPPPAEDGSRGAPTASMAKILTSIAWWRAFGIEQPSNAQVAYIAGYSPTSAAYPKYRSELKQRGLVDYPASGVTSITESGLELVENPKGPFTAVELHRRVREKLQASVVKLLDPLLEAYPGSLATSDLAGASGYSATSAAFPKYRSQLSGLGIITYPAPAHSRAADWLFPTPETP